MVTQLVYTLGIIGGLRFEKQNPGQETPLLILTVTLLIIPFAFSI